MSMKSREIREYLGKGIDPKIVNLIIRMNEEQHQLERQFVELAKLTDRLIDFFNAIASSQHDVMNVVEKMPGATKVLESIRGTKQDLGGDDGHGSQG